MRKLETGFNELSLSTIIAQKQSQSSGLIHDSFSSLLDDKSKEKDAGNSSLDQLNSQQISLQNQAYLNKAFIGI